MSKQRRRRKAPAPAEVVDYDDLPAPKYVEPEEWLKQLADQINRMPAYEVPDSAADGIDVDYDDRNIAAAKEDFAIGYVDLVGVLDAIRDRGDRRVAYLALCRVINGALRVGMSGAMPLGEASYNEEAHARVLRWAKERKYKFAERDRIVLSVVAESEKLGKRPKVDILIEPVNKRLAEDQYSAISRGVLYAIIRKGCGARKSLVQK